MSSAQVLETFADAYLLPVSCWFSQVVDLPARTFFNFLPRHLLSLDEPGHVLTPDHDALLTRWDAGDPSLVTVPRMPDEARDALLGQLIDSVGDAQVKAELARHRTSEVDWRPYSFENLAALTSGGEAVSRAWLALIHPEARAAVARWAEDQRLELEGLCFLSEL